MVVGAPNTSDRGEGGPGGMVGECVFVKELSMHNKCDNLRLLIIYPQKNVNGTFICFRNTFFFKIKFTYIICIFYANYATWQHWNGWGGCVDMRVERRVTSHARTYAQYVCIFLGRTHKPQLGRKHEMKHTCAIVCFVLHILRFFKFLFDNYCFCVVIA